MTLAHTALPGRCIEHLAALSGYEAPLAYVDLDAFELNAGAMLSEAGRMPIRVASKSLRCSALIKHALDLHERFAGVMAFTAREALHLAEQGVASDILIAYPSVEAAPLKELAEWLAAHPDHVIRPMVDDPAQLAVISEAATAAGVEIAVCVDLDTAFRPFGARGPLLGSRRSPLREPEQAIAFARTVAAHPGLKLDAVMAYDGQIAGVGDAPPGRKLRARGIQLMQRRSLSELEERIPRILDALKTELARIGGGLNMVNVGGTGSLSRIRVLKGATELAAGSGFYAPTLFDTYSRLFLTPAAFFVLPVVRRNSEESVTVLGGGYIASGATGADRSPTPVYPMELKLSGTEGAGEVQSPLVGPGTRMLDIGDRVVFRHTKAGELCERFDRLHLIRGGQVVDVVPTYRGEGQTFI